MGFDTMRSFQHLVLSSARNHDIGDEMKDDNLRRQDSFMLIEHKQQQLPGNKNTWSKHRSTAGRGDTCATATAEFSQFDGTTTRSCKLAVAAPSFQVTKARWSPPVSPCSSSPPAPHIVSLQLHATSTEPASPQLPAKEISTLARQLFSAACSGDLDLIKTLLAQGAPINSSVSVPGLFEAFKPAKSGRLSPLAGAASRGQYDAAELLLARGAHLNPDVTRCASSPLHQAVRNNDFELARFLLERGADVNSDNAYKTTPIMYAARYSSPDLVSLILEYKPDLHKVSFINAAAIHWSVWPGHAQIAELLLQAGANPNHQMTDGSTPLHCAVASGSADMVRSLLKYGADPWRPNDNLETPFQLAQGQAECGEILRLLEKDIAKTT